jgi:hypothetical protein
MKQTGSKTLFPVQWLMEGKLLRKVLNGFPARRALSFKQYFFPPLSHIYHFVLTL